MKSVIFDLKKLDPDHLWFLGEWDDFYSLESGIYTLSTGGINQKPKELTPTSKMAAKLVQLRL